MMARNAKSSNEAGFTLIEILIVTVVFVMVFLSVWGAFTDTSQQVNATMAQVDRDVSLRKSLDRIADELANSGTDLAGNDQVLSHPPGVDSTTEFLSFRRRVGLTGDEAADWSDPITYSLVPSPSEIPGNDLDDDGDGIVDESAIERAEGGERIVVVDGVTLFRATRSIGTDGVRIELEIARPGAGAQPASRQTLTTLVSFRNR